MQGLKRELTQGGSREFDESLYQEEWIVKLNTGGEYVLGKEQAWVIQEAISGGNRGIVMFETFSISLPYVAEFYRTKRYLKESQQLPTRATEKVWTEEDRARAIQRVKDMKNKLKSMA